MVALNRAMTDSEFAHQKIGPLFDRIGPAVLDAQTDGRLVRLERHQGEYWLTDKPFNRTSRTIDLSNWLRTPSEPWISRPCGRFTMKKRRKRNP